MPIFFAAMAGLQERQTGEDMMLFLLMYLLFRLCLCHFHLWEGMGFTRLGTDFVLSVEGTVSEGCWTPTIYLPSFQPLTGPYMNTKDCMANG